GRGASAAAAQARVEHVAEGVAQQVVGEDDDADGNAGVDGQPRGRPHVFAALQAQHLAPAGEWRRQAVAEEAQARLGQHDAAETDGRAEDDEVHRVRQDVGPHQTGIAGADHAARLDVRARHDRQDLTAYDAGASWAAEYAD